MQMVLKLLVYGMEPAVFLSGLLFFGLWLFTSPDNPRHVPLYFSLAYFIASGVYVLVIGGAQWVFDNIGSKRDEQESDDSDIPS